MTELNQPGEQPNTNFEKLWEALQPNDRAKVEKIAAGRSTSVQKSLKHIVQLYKFIEETEKNGDLLILETADGKTQILSTSPEE